MASDKSIERAARIIADAARDWTDIESGEHEHSPGCANWQPHTREAQSVLSVFQQAQAETEWEWEYATADYDGTPDIASFRRRKAGPWEVVTE